MCEDCVLVRAKNILIVGGAFGMIIMLMILFMILGFLRRANTVIRRIERYSLQAQSMISLPWKLIEQRLSERKQKHPSP